MPCFLVLAQQHAWINSLQNLGSNPLDSHSEGTNPPTTSPVDHTSGAPAPPSPAPRPPRSAPGSRSPDPPAGHPPPGAPPPTSGSPRVAATGGVPAPWAGAPLTRASCCAAPPCTASVPSRRSAALTRRSASAAFCTSSSPSSTIARHASLRSCHCGWAWRRSSTRGTLLDIGIAPGSTYRLPSSLSNASLSLPTPTPLASRRFAARRFQQF